MPSDGNAHAPPERELSLVIPTYRRPESLRRALAAVAAQEQVVEQVVVVHRRDDRQTVACLRASETAVDAVAVDGAGVLLAMAAGARACRHDLIGFLDDDAWPRPDWGGRIRSHFAGAAVGGVCGRDLIAAPGQVTPSDPRVGQLTRWGRPIGNHHLAEGPAREVTLLKGANMVLRREALALPVDLRGSGAQAHYEVAVSLWARNRGWKLVMDPAAIVDHAPAERHDADRRDDPPPAAIEAAAFNLVYGMLSQRPRLLLPRALYGLLWGDGGTVGVGRAAAALGAGDRRTAARLTPSLRGQLAALSLVLRGRRLEMLQFPR